MWDTLYTCIARSFQKGHRNNAQHFQVCHVLHSEIVLAQSHGLHRSIRAHNGRPSNFLSTTLTFTHTCCNSLDEIDKKQSFHLWQREIIQTIFRSNCAGFNRRIIYSLSSEREHSRSRLTKSCNRFLRRLTCDWKPPISWDFQRISRGRMTSCSRIPIRIWPVARYSSRVSTRVHRYPITSSTTTLLYSGNLPG